MALNTLDDLLGSMAANNFRLLDISAATRPMSLAVFAQEYLDCLQGLIRDFVRLKKADLLHSVRSLLYSRCSIHCVLLTDLGKQSRKPKPQPFIRHHSKRNQKKQFIDGDNCSTHHAFFTRNFYCHSIRHGLLRLFRSWPCDFRPTVDICLPDNSDDSALIHHLVGLRSSHYIFHEFLIAAPSV